MNRRFFPWRVYKRIYFSLVILLLVTEATTLALMFWWGGLAFLNSDGITVVLLSLLFGLLFSALAAYSITRPMAKVLVKTLRLASKKQEFLFADVEEDLFDDEPGEYYELEKALDKIARKLKKRRVQLAHEREESQAMMSAIADAVVSVDRDEKIKYFNSRFASQFMDATALRKYHNDEIKFMEIQRDVELLRALRASFGTGEVRSLQRQLSTKIHPAGRCFNISISPLKEEKGGREVYAVLILLHDVTDVKSSDKMRAEFVENASHELRTPLTSIKGYVAMAREDADQKRFESLPEFLRIISKSVDRLIELVNDLLTISDLEHAAPAEFEMTDLQEITKEVVEGLKPLTDERQIQIKTDVLDDSLRANPRLLGQVMTNLIGNAIKYTQTGGHVQVVWDQHQTEALTPSGQASQWIRLRVKDNGPGIPEEAQARLFERFYRVDKARSRDVGGTGLGLAIVKHVMLSHGGEVFVTSRSGQGTEFTCLFPKTSNY